VRLLHALAPVHCRVFVRPCSYIYAYPDLTLQHTLPAGTERAYSAACFSPDGTKLAAVGSAPDYTLTLWDWAAGACGKALLTTLSARGSCAEASAGAPTHSLF
jgi:hypothetical protein